VTGGRAIARLAIRESWARPWRSLLIILLIALPTAAAVFASTWLHSAIDTPEEEVAHFLGKADLLVLPGAVEADEVGSMLASQPGWRVVAYRSSFGPVTTPESAPERARATLLDLPLDDPLTRGIASVVSGRAPASPSEVAASPRLLRRLGVGLGGRIVLIRPHREVTVTGVLNREPILGGEDVLIASGLRGGASQPPTFLVDLPTGARVPPALVARLGAASLTTREQALSASRAARRDFRVYLYLLGGLALAAFGLVVASALAVGARRRLRMLGLLGISGASPRQAGALILIQGAVLGAIGALVGIGLGIGLAFLARPRVERFTGQAEGAIELQAGDYAVLGLFALVVATAAALLPARTIARTPTAMALAGRVPLGRVGFRVPVAGVALSVLGCLALAVAASARSGEDRDAAIGIVGGALVIGGLVACAPYLVGLLEWVGKRTSGTLRLATRTLARHRSRTGPTVAAIAATGALAIAATTLAVSAAAHERASSDTPTPEASLVSVSIVGADGPVSQPDCAEIEGFVQPLLARETEGLTLRCLDYATAVAQGDRRTADLVTVLTPRGLAGLGAEQYSAVLRAGRAIHIGAGPRSRFLVPRGGSGAPVVVVQGPRLGPFARDYLRETYLVSPATAAHLGVVNRQRRNPLAVVQSDGPLSGAQLADLRRLNASDAGLAYSTAQRDVYVGFDNVPADETDLGRLAYAVIVPVAIVLALLTALVGLSLTAAESRDERATLVAVGAGPAQRRRQNAWQALIVTAIGALLALPAGLVPAAVVLHADGAVPMQTPWPILAGLLFCVPLLAAVGGALLTRAFIQPISRRSL